MYELDKRATEHYLIAKLKKEEHPSQFTIGSMGLIASPVFLEALELFFKKNPPELPRKSNPDSYLPMYALHRCKGIHHWYLQKSADGQYFIDKSKTNEFMSATLRPNN